ncbi:MAG: hypothetical protein R2690_03235 [Acidimicrobiales bacterium]
MTDLSGAYRLPARRGVGLFDRDCAVVRDELDLGAGAAVEWAMHTRRHHGGAPDGRSATLTQGGVVLEAHLDAATAGAFRGGRRRTGADVAEPRRPDAPNPGYASSWSA